MPSGKAVHKCVTGYSSTEKRSLQTAQRDGNVCGGNETEEPQKPAQGNRSAQ